MIVPNMTDKMQLDFNDKKIEYEIMDPTGNITALVETQVDPADQPAVASGIMDLHPDVEQVGFVTLAAAGAGAPEADGPCADADASRAETGVPVSLRMAGGEFCGNATMCAAALYMMKTGMTGEASVKVRVSGAKEPLEVKLTRRDALSFDTSVEMPPALGIEELRLADGMLPGSDVLRLPVVIMEGISHILVEPDSGFFGLKDDRALAETLLRGWCGVLGSDCLGMMFLGEDGNVRALTPLVYVPGADTMFWENSCASGSAAAGIYLAAKAGRPVNVTFDEPAGRLRVESDPMTGRTVLHGSVIAA